MRMRLAFFLYSADQRISMRRRDIFRRLYVRCIKSMGGRL
ncbi:hypothetical protein BURPS1106B_A3412 [Burkholderia pseudomallei 1106b]|uniref:Uncharacterized protein n=1 Tax=Burkholderia pseudomallei (strain 1106a) TaxID=357348 RepID=A3NPZ1_BURP0|nr:hypothetical protein BURPS1106A_0127 [Burkholderia pseudomallei 1106a]EES27584.1 hypothetical protein BURPS1106B_A3412 [Burkholderia pseudomallei 1106b]